MAEDHSGFKALAAIDMNSKQIHNVANPSTAQDAATVNWCQTSQVNSVVQNVGVQNENLNMNSHKINNVTDPTSAQDAATKAYVDAAGFTSRARVYRSGYQNLPADTWTKIQFNVETYDGANEYNTSTFKFTAGSAGYYLINAQVWILHMDANSDAELGIKVNGSRVVSAQEYTPKYGSVIPSCSDIIHLSAGDYVEVSVRQYSATAKNVNGSSNLTYMSIHRLS